MLLIYKGNNLLDSGYPLGAPWNLWALGGFGDWCVWMIHPRGREKVVAVLEGYLDESGINPTDRYCVVAGLVGSSPKWQRFETQWLKASGGVDFHGKEFFARDRNGCRVGPYRDWTDAQAADYLDALITVMTQTPLTPIGAVVDVADFMSFTLTERQYLTGRMFHRRKDKWTGSGAPGKPFFFAFSDSLAQAAMSIRNGGLQVHVVFDQQNHYAPHAMRIFQDNKKNIKFMGERLGELAFKSKAGVGGLQAADMLAHACHRRGRFKVGERQELDRVTSQLRQMTHKRIALFNKVGLQKRLQTVPPEVARALKWGGSAS